MACRVRTLQIDSCLFNRVRRSLSNIVSSALMALGVTALGIVGAVQFAYAETTYSVGGVPVERLSTRVDKDGNMKPINPASGSESAVGSSGVGSSGVDSSGNSSEPPPQSSMWELYNQLEILKEEIGQLRGLVETQTRELELLRRQQKEHYIDLDHRIEMLSQSESGNQKAPVADKTIKPANASTATTASKIPSNSEKDQYNEAIELVKSKRLAEAAQALNEFLKRYSNNLYTANAHYWLGEVYLAQESPNYDKAREQFETVTKKFPTHPKAAACLYKLGVLSLHKGDEQQAKQLFQSVVDRFPDSSASGLAQKKLSNLAQ